MTPRGLEFFVFGVLASLLLDVESKPPRNARNLANQTERISQQASDSSLSSLEDALQVLANLSASQKEMWEQQQLREEELRLKNQAEEEKEAARTKALQEEHKMIIEMRAKVSRKLRAMSRPQQPPYGAIEQDGFRSRDCADLYLEGKEGSGVYRVWPTWRQEEKGFLVYCDMDTDEGGWTVIRRWGSNKFSSSFFKKTWYEYKYGFGDILNDFWLGNEQVYMLTNQGSHEVRFDITTGTGNLTTRYGKFWIESESGWYRAHVEILDPQSTAGDLFSIHDGAPFSATDRNNLESPQTTGSRYSNYENVEKPKCSIGWWFKSDCSISKYLKPAEDVSGAHVKEMKIRPSNFVQMKLSP